jgi:hypothetical protein
LARSLVDLGRHILDRQCDAARQAVAASRRAEGLDGLTSVDDLPAAASAAIHSSGPGTAGGVR